MNRIYFTITGTNYYHGKDFIKEGMFVKLIKEPDNEYDNEAIRVELDGLGKIGYVANSPYTVCGESYSAGRLYDKIGKRSCGVVKYVLSKGILCCIEEEYIRPKKHSRYRKSRKHII